MLTWNDILDIELRNKDNPDVERLITAMRSGEFDDVYTTRIQHLVEDIRDDRYWFDDGSDKNLANDPAWEALRKAIGL